MYVCMLCYMLLLISVIIIRYYLHSFYQNNGYFHQQHLSPNQNKQVPRHHIFIKIILQCNLHVLIVHEIFTLSTYLIEVLKKTPMKKFPITSRYFLLHICVLNMCDVTNLQINVLSLYYITFFFSGQHQQRNTFIIIMY